MATIFVGNDTHRATEREEAARQKLYDHVTELRASLLDLLTLVSASNDPIPAIAGIARGPIETLRQRIRDIEHADAKIHRARSILDGSKDDAKFTGP